MQAIVLISHMFKERWHLVLEEVQADVEDVRTSRMVSMLRWDGALERKLTWNDIWKGEPQSRAL